MLPVGLLEMRSKVGDTSSEEIELYALCRVSLVVFEADK
jgi:hypothetical protein